jgi:cobalt-zinc-cadmium efflux system outer membrane protein
MMFGLAAAMMVVSLPALAQDRIASAAAARFTDPANGLSLGDAIARAVAREPSLRAARSQIEIARAERLQAGLRPNPSLAVERREEPGGTDTVTQISVDWPLDLFRKPGRVAVGDRQVTAAAHAVADRERRLVADVRMRYGELLVAIRDLQVLDRLAVTTRQQRDVVAARAAEGASPPLDRDLLHVEWQQLESARLLQVGRTDAALFALKRVIGMPAAEPLTVRDTLERVVLAEAGAELPPEGTAVAARPDVREAEARVSVADAMIDRARRDGRLDLSVFGAYMMMDAGFPQQGIRPDGGVERVRATFHYLSGGVRLTLPWRNRNQGATSAAQAERAGAEAALEAARLTAEIDIAAARAVSDRARQALSVYSAGVPALAAQNLSVMQQSYDLGRVTLSDVLAEQRRYLDVERAYTEAMRAAYDAHTAFVFAMGGQR